MALAAQEGEIAAAQQLTALRAAAERRRMVVLVPERGSSMPTRSEMALEAAVFHYEPRYFDYLGPEEPDVVAFRRLVERRDLRGLRRHWGELATAFVRRETVLGHKGRPLLMDYYFNYEGDLVELGKCRLEATSTTTLAEQVFRYETDLFAALGADHPDVVAFRELVERRDLTGLRESWARLRDSFVRLGAAAGSPPEHRFEERYFLSFEALVELCSRRGGPGAGCGGAVKG